MKALPLIIFAIALVAASAAWGESLMDIKSDELSQPVKSKWGNDPFLRLEDRDSLQSSGGLALPEFSLDGIMTDGRKALAIIDGGFYRKGDTLEGFIIDDILSDRVVLKKNGRSYMLQVKGFTINRPAKEAGQ